MPSREQVSYHYQMLDEAARAQAVREAEARAQMAAFNQAQLAQQGGLQQRRDYDLAAYQMQAQQQAANEQRARDQLLLQGQQRRDYEQFTYGSAQQQQAAANQQAAMQQQAGYQWNSAIQHKDLQAELNQTMLTQAEKLRLERMRTAVGQVRSDPRLTDDEKSDLIMQLQTGLNPLENRQRQAGIIQSQLQSQALHQNTQQQATLFNQRQEWLGRGINGQIQYLTDPETGIRQAFHVDPEGRIQPLDFAQARQLHQLRMEQGQMGMLGQAQGMIQSAQTHPLQVADMQRQLGFNAQADPLRLTAMQQGIRREDQAFNYLTNLQPMQLEAVRQQVAQGPRAFESEMAHREASTALLRLDARQRPEAHHLNMMALGQQIAQGPQAFQSRQALQTAQTRLADAHTAEIQARIDGDPLLEQVQREFAMGRVTLQELNIERARAENRALGAPSPVTISPQTISTIRGRHIQDVRQELRHVPQAMGGQGVPVQGGGAAPAAPAWMGEVPVAGPVVRGVGGLTQQGVAAHVENAIEREVARRTQNDIQAIRSSQPIQATGPQSEVVAQIGLLMNREQRINQENWAEANRLYASRNTNPEAYQSALARSMAASGNVGALQEISELMRVGMGSLSQEQRARFMQLLGNLTPELRREIQVTDERR